MTFSSKSRNKIIDSNFENCKIPSSQAMVMFTFHGRMNELDVILLLWIRKNPTYLVSRSNIWPKWAYVLRKSGKKL